MLRNHSKKCHHGDVNSYWRSFINYRNSFLFVFLKKEKGDLMIHFLEILIGILIFLFLIKYFSTLIGIIALLVIFGLVYLHFKKIKLWIERSIDEETFNNFFVNNHFLSNLLARISIYQILILSNRNRLSGYIYSNLSIPKMEKEQKISLRRKIC